MSDIRLNLDDCAFEIRGALDNASAYLAAKNTTTISHATGLIEAAGAQMLADVILRQLDPRLIEERDRFQELRREARQTLESFKRLFNFVQRADGSTIEIHSAATPSNGHIKHVGENRLQPSASKRGGTKKRLSPAEWGKIDRQILDQGPWTGAEMRAKAAEWGIGYSTLSKRYYELIGGGK